jgi:PAS domain S-box-containing protein
MTSSHGKQLRYRLSNAVFLLATFGGVLALAALGVQILRQHQALQDAPTSNVLWSLSQTEVSLLALAMIAALLFMLAYALRQLRQARRLSRDEILSNQRYASAVTAALDAMVVSDAEGRIVDFNPAAERTFGYSRKEAIGQLMHDVIIPPMHREAHKAGMARYIKTGVAKVLGARRVELDGMRSDGSIFPAELSIGTAGGGEGREAQIFIGYIRDISERTKTRAELTRARDAALKAAKAKSDFLAVMSHEMRTPLNGVMGILDLLSHTDMDKQQSQYVATAMNSGEILQGHINDVLDITSIDAGAMELQPAEHDLQQLLEEVARINEPAAIARGNHIEVRCDCALSKITQDRGRLSQILMNLVGNAVKFTSNGTIAIHAARAQGQENMLEISVSDTGIGMAQDDHARIFDAFFMIDPSYQRSSQGTGLGLTICRRIVEAMGGHMGVASAEGEGSRFWLRVPLLDAGAAQERANRPRPDLIDLEGAAHVLVIEDNETNRFVARELLQRAGCRVSEAHDGVEGVERAKGERFDLILMDISMPRMNGIAATRAIRSQDGLSSTAPIVALTAHALAHEREELLKAGMQDCLIKPLRERTLNALLMKCLGDDQGDIVLPVEEENGVDSPLDPAVMNELADALPDTLLLDRLKGFHAELAYLSEDGFGPTSDGEKVAEQAHRQAGSAAIFGARRLQQWLSQIEKAANESSGDVGELIAAMQPDVVAAQAAVEELIEALEEGVA